MVYSGSKVVTWRDYMGPMCWVWIVCNTLALLCSCYLERLHGTEGFEKSKDQATDLQCAEENNGSRLKSATGINYNPKIPYLETKAGDQTRNIKMVAYIKLIVFIPKISTMYKEKSCLYKLISSILTHTTSKYIHRWNLSESVNAHTCFPIVLFKQKTSHEQANRQEQYKGTASGHFIYTRSQTTKS